MLKYIETEEKELYLVDELNAMIYSKFDNYKVFIINDDVLITIQIFEDNEIRASIWDDSIDRRLIDCYTHSMSKIDIAKIIELYIEYYLKKEDEECGVILCRN